MWGQPAPQLIELPGATILSGPQAPTQAVCDVLSLSLSDLPPGISSMSLQQHSECTSDLLHASGALAVSGSTSPLTSIADLLPDTFPLCTSSFVVRSPSAAQPDGTLQPDTPPVAESAHSFGSNHRLGGVLQMQGQHKQRRLRRGEQQVQSSYADSTIFFAGVSPIATVEALMSVFDQFGQVVDINLFRPYRTCKTSKGCGLVIYSQRSEATLAMETLAGRFVWPGARTPIVVEFFSPTAKQQQQQQQPKPAPLPASVPAAALPNLTGFGPIAAPGTLQQLQVRQLQHHNTQQALQHTQQPLQWHLGPLQQPQQQQQMVTTLVPSSGFPPGLVGTAALFPASSGAVQWGMQMHGS